MSRVPYSKPALSYIQQLQLLKDRGLSVENEDKALHLLKNLSYYRLSGYWFPLLLDKRNHVFKKGSTFESAFDLYCFDRELRMLILREIEKIEVAVRAQMAYILSHNYGPFWFRNPALFKNKFSHTRTLESIESEYKRSDEQFIKAFQGKYNDVFPPSWMTLEIVSFGTLSILFNNLKPGHTKRKIANYFGLDDKTFASWLHSIVYLRNVCAHHSRLWNRVMSIRPRLPRRPHRLWLTNLTQVTNNKSYYILSMLLYLLHIVNPNNKLKEKFKPLLKKYPNIDTKAMGFPKNWGAEKLWEEL